jgi:hypothetical protein
MKGKLRGKRLRLRLKAINDRLGEGKADRLG